MKYNSDQQFDKQKSSVIVITEKNALKGFSRIKNVYVTSVLYYVFENQLHSV